jgi:hypothetical protein
VSLALAEAVGRDAPRPLRALDPTADSEPRHRDTDRRASRKRAHAVLRSLTGIKRVRHCGAVGVGESVAVMAAKGPNGNLIAGVAGTQTCASVWACPTCSAKIADHRTKELEDGIRRWVDPEWRAERPAELVKVGRRLEAKRHAIPLEDRKARKVADRAVRQNAASLNVTKSSRWNEPGSFMLVTLTVRHHARQPLAHLWDLVGDSWRDTVAHRSYKDARRALDVAGYHRTTEATIGASGWHVHLHVLYWLNGTPTPDRVAAEGGAIVAQWIKSVQANGGSATLDGQDWRMLAGDAEALSGIAGYVHKGVYVEQDPTTGRTAGHVAMEVGRGDLKRARFGTSRAPFELLGDVVAEVEETGTVDATDWALWSEWEQASKGRRQQVWSRGLRDLLGLGEELTDEQIAEVTLDGEELLRVKATDWRTFTLDGVREANLLDAIEKCKNVRQARRVAARMLTGWGVPFELPDGPGFDRPEGPLRNGGGRF